MAAPKGHPPYPGCEKGGAFGHLANRSPDKWTEEALDAEAEALREWAKKDDSIVLRKFASERGYFWEMINQWKHKHKGIASAQKFAKDAVGCRREEKALYNKIDTGIVKASLGTYDDEHRQFLIDIKNAEASQSNTYYLNEDVDTKKIEKALLEKLKKEGRLKE